MKLTRLSPVAALAAVALAAMLGACSGGKKDKTADRGGSRLRVDTAANRDTARMDLTLTDASAMPEFPGGFDAMRAYIKANVRVPQAAREMKKEGRVIVTAKVDATGHITSCDVFMSDDAVFNEEALRVVRSMPKFRPAHRGGKAVASECKIPVMFRL